MKVVTSLALLRFRFKLIIRGRRERLLVVEEAAAIAFDGVSTIPIATGLDAWALLETNASGNLTESARDRMIEQARTRIASLLDGPIAEFGRSRAAQLADDHGRVRAAGINVPKVSVEPVFRADVMGAFALVRGTSSGEIPPNENRSVRHDHPRRGTHFLRDARSGR